MSETILSLESIVRTFIQGDNRLDILRHISLTLSRGEMVALVGPSGSGKSTLLHIAGLLEQPDKGTITIMGHSCQGLSDEKRSLVRQKTIGFVYQYHHLLPEFSALENVVIPQMLSGKSKKESILYAKELLDQLGLSERFDHRPGQLSGGEQQRVAIARALANQPVLLLADEPTGNLDSDNSMIVFDALLSLVKSAGLSALIATHNPDLASKMDRTLVLRQGQLHSQI
jgi:lipoprotein-releasing system ATP-binding protein